MKSIILKLDHSLKKANIGRAFSVFGSPPNSGMEDAHYVVIYTSYPKRGNLIWFCQSARQFLCDNLEIVYRYSDIPEDNILKDTTFLYAFTTETAEKICDHFDDIAANDAIDFKYMEPHFMDRGDVAFDL